MTTTNAKPTSIRLCAAGLLALAGIFCLTGAVDLMETNRRRIEEMSASQRLQLERNWQRYQAMTEAQRQVYRNLHNGIVAEPRLNDVMREYCKWLDTLSPWQRKELQQETNVRRRVEMVKEMRAEQAAERKERVSAQMPAIAEKLSWLQDPSRSRLSREEFAAIIETLGKNLKPRDEDRKDGKNVTEIRRCVRIIELLGERPAAGEAPAISETQVNEAIGKITNTRLRDFLRRIPEVEHQRHALVGLLAQSLVANLKDELANSRPSDQQIQEFFAQLEPAARDEVMREPYDLQKQRLVALYYEQHPSQAPAAAKELRMVVSRLLPGILEQFGNHPPPNPDDHLGGAPPEPWRDGRPLPTEEGDTSRERPGPPGAGRFGRRPGLFGRGAGDGRRMEPPPREGDASDERPRENGPRPADPPPPRN